MIRFTFTHRGAGATAARIRSGQCIPIAKLKAAMLATGKHLHEKSLALCPDDTGSLQESSHVREEGTGFAVKIIVGYGIEGDIYENVFSPREGKSVTRVPYNYAVFMHEAGKVDFANVRLPHSPGQIEFLATPLREGLAELRTVFHTHMR